MPAGDNYPNIRIFDYFDLTANTNNVLRAEYEVESSSTDNHPNTQAAEDVGPVFAQFIVDSAQSFFDSVSAAICGNSIVEGNEECDDGADNGSSCTPEPGSTCTYCSSTCELQIVNSSKNFSWLHYLLLLTGNNQNK